MTIGMFEHKPPKSLSPFLPSLLKLIPFIPLGLAMVCMPAVAADVPVKQTSAEDLKQAEKKRMQGAPLTATKPAGGLRVTNPVPTQGGAEKETVSPAERRTPTSIRQRERAVTKNDFDRLTDEKMPTVHRVRATPHSSAPGAAKPETTLPVSKRPPPKVPPRDRLTDTHTTTKKKSSNSD